MILCFQNNIDPRRVSIAILDARRNSYYHGLDFPIMIFPPVLL